jgi:hypothetical protein
VPGARRHPEIHSFRSRHSRVAASPPASLPALTVPRRVRLGRAPRRTGRIAPLGARPLPERTSGGRGALLSNARDLRPLAAVPLDAISASLHRPLRGTPRIAPGPRSRKYSQRRSKPRLRSEAREPGSFSCGRLPSGGHRRRSRSRPLPVGGSSGRIGGR